MKIYPKCDPADFIEVEMCPMEKSLCSLSLMITAIGASITYLDLAEVETLQKELSVVAAQMRTAAAREATTP